MKASLIRFRIPPWLLAVLCGVTSGASLLRAEAVLDLTFDDPQGLIRGREESIAVPGPEFSRSNATIASGRGGRALPQVTAKGPDPAEVSFSILTEPPLGTSAFLRISLGAAEHNRAAGAGIVSDEAESSLSAIAERGAEGWVINGGFDFFFRTDKDWMDEPPKFNVWTKVGPLTLALETDSRVGRGLSAKIATNQPLLVARSGGSGPRVSLTTRVVNEIPIEPGEIYHAAVVFHTDPEGWISLRVYLRKGIGALAVGEGEGLNAAIDGFRVNGDATLDSGPGKVALNLGRKDFAQSLDLARFRIFKPAPEDFPGLE